MTAEPGHIAEKAATRERHYLAADLHTYVVPVPPKSMGETMAVVQFALHELERQRPGYNAGGSIATHLEKVQQILDECARKRPTGRGGKHGDLHTPECGCRR